MGGIYVNGQYLVQPQANVSIASTPQGAATNASSRTLFLLGSATDGQPQTPITVNSPAQAFSVFKDGNLVQAAVYAFNGSPVAPGPSSITVLRVDEATQATANLQNGANTEITLTSTSYGTLANLVKYQIAAGSSHGYKVTIASDYTGPATTAASVSQDNVYLPVLSVYYSGTGTSPTVTVTDTQITYTATTSDTGGSVTFTAGMTVQQLVNQLNQFTGWSTTVADPNPLDLLIPTDTVPGSTTLSLPALLDNISSTTVSTSASSPTTLYANIAAVVRLLNNGTFQPWVTAVRAANATTLADTTNWVYLAGGTVTAPASTDWQTGFNNLETVQGLGVVVPVTQATSATTSVGAMAVSHCEYMTGIGQQRIAILGDQLGQTLAEEITNAQGYMSPLAVLRWPGFKTTGDIYGNQSLQPPYMEAARTAGILVGSPPQQALTLLPVQALSLETSLSSSNIDSAILGGICVTKQSASGGFVIASGVTTWSNSTQFDKVNINSEVIEGVIIADLKQVLEQQLVGFNSNLSPQTAAMAYGIVNQRLSYWASRGLLVGDSTNPPYSNIQVTVSSNAVQVTANIHPANTTNFATVKLTASPWTS